ncbi:hypothetical protein FPRO04_13208 [Fusarium proliferatum]|nr:hypothetical protein FPRO04_13208 [Fusarium proliferatum]
MGAMMTTTIKRYYENPESKNQGLSDCPKSPSEEIKDRITLDRRREDNHGIHKTSSKKFKDNPHVAYAYSQMPMNEPSHFIMQEFSADDKKQPRIIIDAARSLNGLTDSKASHFEGHNRYMQ